MKHEDHPKKKYCWMCKPDNDPLVQLGWVRTSTKKKVNKLKKLVVVNGVRKPETLDAVISRIIK